MRVQRFDVFCRVVDNYGDAGVSWRLARQLAREHRAAVTLWIDDKASLARVAPTLDAARDEQKVDDVRVRALVDPLADYVLPDVTIEAFGCGLPDRYLEAMAGAKRPPVWINLEYLSAEPWVDGTHGLPSLQPRLPLTRHFYFPGFTASTGGLLREAGLLDARRAAQADIGARRTFWRALGIELPTDAFAVSIFCYPNRALSALLDAWAQGDESIVCCVPEGVATASIEAWSGGAIRHAGESTTRGRLTLATIPFVSQDSYDRLLWHCDVNFVRGEDSFVRAQWAARPFVWHIYPQADDAHRAKLEEFLHRYVVGLQSDVRVAAARFWRAWNDSAESEVGATWREFRAAFRTLSDHGQRWCGRLEKLPDLASELVGFARDRL